MAERRKRFLKGVGRWGTVRAGAEAAGMARKEAEKWMERDEGLRKEFEEARAAFEESVGRKLLRQAERGGGDGATLRFWARAALPERYGIPRVARAASPAGERDEAGRQAEGAKFWAELERKDAKGRVGEHGGGSD